jgi:hypothetical protein
MRTTLNLDEDAFQPAKAYAQSRSLALGKAVSELVRRGLAAPMNTRVVVATELGPWWTSEDVKRIESEFE